MVQEYQAIVTG